MRRGWLRDHLPKQPPQPGRRSEAGTIARSSPATHSPGRDSTPATTSPPTPTDRVPSSPRWSAPATAGADSPAAASPPGSATSTTCGPGRSGAPPPPTCSPSADDTTASSNDPDGDCAWHPTAPPPGPTPPAESAPPAPLDALRSFVLVPDPSEHPTSTPTARTAENDTNAVTTGASGRTPACPGHRHQRGRDHGREPGCRHRGRRGGVELEHPRDDHRAATGAW